MFDEMERAISCITSRGILIRSISAFFSKIAVRVSKSGCVISTTNPLPNRPRSLSISVFNSMGGLSLDITICLLSEINSLNVWKNSSCVPSLFSRK
jgi:hypothetical protein